MSSEFEKYGSDRSSRDDNSPAGNALYNEAYILTNGIAGSFSEIGKAASDAVDHPGETAFKIGTSALVGGAIGFCASKAGIGGLLARGVAAALGTQFVIDGISPLKNAMDKGWSATSMRELDVASHHLSTGLGRFTFDSMISLPFAMTGSLAGRGLRSALTEPIKVTPKVAPTAESVRVSSVNDTLRSGLGRNNTQFRSTRGFTDSGRSSDYYARTKPKVEVVEGELIDPEPVSKNRFNPKPPEEIIDAEFWEVKEPGSKGELPGLNRNRLALPGTQSTDLVPVNTDLTLRQGPVVVRQSLATRIAPDQLKPSAAYMKKAMDAYRQPPGEDTGGSIVDIKA